MKDLPHSKSRRLRPQQFSIIFRKTISDQFSNFQFHNLQSFYELFYKNEQIISLSSRLINWHDLIVPSLAKLENESSFQENFIFMNQRGMQTKIDLNSLLFQGKSQKLFNRKNNLNPHTATISLQAVTGAAVAAATTTNTPTTTTATAPTIHHFIHQLKLQHSSLIGEKRKIFENSWRFPSLPPSLFPPLTLSLIHSLFFLLSSLAILDNSLSPFTGTFIEQSPPYFSFLKTPPPEQIIFRMIDQTSKESFRKSQQLRYASDAQKGVQLIHLFIMDILEVGGIVITMRG